MSMFGDYFVQYVKELMKTQNQQDFIQPENVMKYLPASDSNESQYSEHDIKIIQDYELLKRSLKTLPESAFLTVQEMEDYLRNQNGVAASFRLAANTTSQEYLNLYRLKQQVIEGKVQHG